MYIHMPEDVIRLPCACANLRRAARAVTQYYDQTLRPCGLRSTQFTLLQALDLAPGFSQKQLAELLAIDSTTLTRTLAGLRQRKWIRVEKGADRREIHLFLTAEGQRQYRRAHPYWQKAQDRLRSQLGQTGWNDVMSAAVRAAGVAVTLP